MVNQIIRLDSMKEISLNDFYVIVEASIIDRELLQEGRNGIQNGIEYRFDPPNAYAKQQYHVHIGDYAWNIDGTRSHRSRWPSHEPTRRIKQVAADQLGISVEMLERLNPATTVIMQPFENILSRVLEEAFFD